MTNVTTDVDKPETVEQGEPGSDDGSRLVISGGEGYVDFRIGTYYLQYFLFTIRRLYYIIIDVIRRLANVSFPQLICGVQKN